MGKAKNIFILTLILVGFSINFSFAQEFLWQFGVHSFFNNNEFAGSSIKNSQTMAGARFAPQIGFGYDERHRAFIGIDALQEFGSYKGIDDFAPVAYYQFDDERFVFYMGAFPRKQAIDNYPRMFFQDSIKNYRPIMNGFFWEFRSPKDDCFNVWLDWTGRQTAKTREAFFMGWSGRYNRGIFYGIHYGYMFHYAGSMNPVIPESVIDNGLLLTSIGVSLSENTNFEKLDLNVGWLVGLERDRGASKKWQNPNGFISELKVEYRGVGLFNSFYSGNRQQIRYHLHQNSLYWGDPAYRAKTYNRTDFYINFIRNSAVNVKFIYSLHFLERNMYHEQSLYATFDLDMNSLAITPSKVKK